MACKYVQKIDSNKNIYLCVDDPIYGKFEVPHPFSKIVLCKEMQRLKNISQTGFAHYQWPGLEEGDRLSHSMGAFYLMGLMIDQIEKGLSKYDVHISEKDKNIALCAILLHDIGHGPFSHSFEAVTKSSHELRTSQIIEENTEVHKVMVQEFGKESVPEIASYIVDIGLDKANELKIENNIFHKLIKSLISHQLDADRLDFCLRDRYWAGIKSAIDYKKLIDSITVTVDYDNNFFIYLKGVSGVMNAQNLISERSNNYYYLYYCKASKIIEEYFMKVMQMVVEHPEYIPAKVQLPKMFKKIIKNPTNISTKDFVEMVDDTFNDAIAIIKESTTNPVLAHFCDFQKAYDNSIDILNAQYDSNKIKKQLLKIFPKEYHDAIAQTQSIIEKSGRTKIYKKDIPILADIGHGLEDIFEAINIVRPGEIMNQKYLVINIEALRLELNLDETSFFKYKEKIMKMVDDINRPQEEFELKYALTKSVAPKAFIKALTGAGFKLISDSKCTNQDEYYDTEDTSLLQCRHSLRIRAKTVDDKIQYEGAYKKSKGYGEVYSYRSSSKVDLKQNDVDELKNYFFAGNENLSKRILSNPVLTCFTNRHNFIVQKNNVDVSISFDKTKYRNHLYNDTKKDDFIIEIEALGGIENRYILNEINTIIENNFDNIQTNKQSKYERGFLKKSS